MKKKNDDKIKVKFLFIRLKSLKISPSASVSFQVYVVRAKYPSPSISQRIQSEILSR